jgi:hypothetical protein
MENLHYINPLLHGIIPYQLEEKTNTISTSQLLCAGVGSLLAAVVLKKAGHSKTGNLIGSLAIPLLATAVYRKLGLSAADNENTDEPAEAQTEYA